MKKIKISRIAGIILLCGFVVWTAVILTVGRGEVGPLRSSVGLSGLNSDFSEIIGSNMLLYSLTDILSIIPIGMVLCFASVGCIQLFKRRSLLRVDKHLILLGGYLLLVFALYLLFDLIAVNYRPVLIDGALEPSYPSSTTLLVICVDFTCAIELEYIPWKKGVRKLLMIGLYLFTIFMIGARILSGVHWITDIIGGILLGSGLVSLYASFRPQLEK